MKLYTLKECFEQAGSIFPFTVYAYPEILGIQRLHGKYEITFHGCEYYDEVHKMVRWWVKNPQEELANVITFTKCSHIQWALRLMYSYKIVEYNKDFKKLLD